jgi:hypothetical protein
MAVVLVSDRTTTRTCRIPHTVRAFLVYPMGLVGAERISAILGSRNALPGLPCAPTRHLRLRESDGLDYEFTISHSSLVPVFDHFDLNSLYY